MGIKIGIINPSGLELSTQKALELLVESFSKQNVSVNFCLYTNQLPSADLFIGTYEKSRIIRDLVEKESLPLNLTPEALIIQEIQINGENSLIACGFDTRGLDYALYELAARVNSQSVTALYKPVNETPFIKLRGVIHYFSGKELRAGWTFPREYWVNYFNFLVRNRFNSFSLVFDAPYFSSPFPFLFYIPEHPEVGYNFLFSEKIMENNLNSLNEFATLARESGLDFHLGLHNFLPNIGELEKHPAHIDGLNSKNVESYLYLGLKQLIFSCPQISGLEVNFFLEPTQNKYVNQTFFYNTFIKAIIETGNQIQLKINPEQFNSETIQQIVKSDIKTVLSSSFWGKYAGLPYPAEKSKPIIIPESNQDSVLINSQLNIYGTSPVLPWGDPDYVHTLLDSLENLGYKGLEIVPPVARKNTSKIREEKPLNSNYQYFKWEYERHWYLYQIFGRLSFNPHTTGEVLIRNFHRRFGEKGNQLAEIYSLAGKVLPLYVGVHINKEDPSNWPETEVGGLLEYYLRVPPGDPSLFSSFEEYTNSILSGTKIAKISPLYITKYFKDLGTKILEKIKAIEDYLPRGDEDNIKEWQTLLIDFSILGNFSLYHSRKFKAAHELSLFYKTKDLHSLNQAIIFLKKARTCWEKIITLTNQAYQQRLYTEPGISPIHWSKKIILLLEDEKRLNLLKEEYLKRTNFLLGFDFGSPPSKLDKAKTNIFPDFYVEMGFIQVDHLSKYNLETGFGWQIINGLQSISSPPIRLNDRDLSPFLDNYGNTEGFFPYPYENLLLNDLVWSRKPATFIVDLNPGSYLVHLTFCDHSPEARKHGPMTIKVNNRILAKDLIINIGNRVDLREIFEIEDGKLTIEFSCAPHQDWFISALSISPITPVIAHTPVFHWVVSKKPLEIYTTVWGIHPIQQVILNYRSGEERGYHMMVMTPIALNLYCGKIPATYFDSASKINYYFTVLDNQGTKISHGSYESPLSIELIKEDNLTPFFFHSTPSKTEHQDLKFKFSARPFEAVKEVLLFYQVEGNKLKQLIMEGNNGEFEGIIPSSDFLPNCSINYRFAITMNNGMVLLYPNPVLAFPYLKIALVDSSGLG